MGGYDKGTKWEQMYAESGLRLRVQWTWKVGSPGPGMWVGWVGRSPAGKCSGWWGRACSMMVGLFHFSAGMLQPVQFRQNEVQFLQAWRLWTLVTGKCVKFDFVVYSACCNIKHLPETCTGTCRHPGKSMNCFELLHGPHNIHKQSNKHRKQTLMQGIFSWETGRSSYRKSKQNFESLKFTLATHARDTGIYKRKNMDTIRVNGLPQEIFSKRKFPKMYFLFNIFFVILHRIVVFFSRKAGLMANIRLSTQG